MFYKLAKYPFNLTWNLIFILVTVTLWRIAPPSSLKTAFKLLTTTTVRHNPNFKRYETFMHLIKTIRYSYFRWRRVAGVDGKRFRIFGIVIEVRGNSKTKGLERGRKRRARLRCLFLTPYFWFQLLGATISFPLNKYYRLNSDLLCE